jgi:hypothetical protein
MDADDISLPERLQIQYDYLEKNLDILKIMIFIYVYFQNEKNL